MITPMTTGFPATLTQASTPIKFASYWRRGGAYFIDSIILTIADSIIAFISGLASPAVSLISSLFGSGIDLTGIWQIASVVIRLAVPAVYFTLAYSSGGQSIGKAILGIKVVSIDGSPLTWRTGILRTIGYVPSTIVFGLGFLSAVWDKEKQAWHDKIAGTCVVRASVPRDALAGRIEPKLARLKQRSWLVVLGILTVLAFAAFGLLIRAGTSEVAEMGPWPSRDVRPEQVAAIDLQHLGLTMAQVTDARSTNDWAGGGYDTGAVVIYTAEQQEIVAITALQYSNIATASSEFRGFTDWAKENCPWYSYVASSNTGVIRCGGRGSHVKILWSGYWVLAIIALDGGQFPAQDLADKVRDAIAANWKIAGESSR